MATFKPNGIRRNTPTHATADDAIRHTSDRTHNGTELVKNATPDAAILKSENGAKGVKGVRVSVRVPFLLLFARFLFFASVRCSYRIFANHRASRGPFATPDLLVSTPFHCLSLFSLLFAFYYDRVPERYHRTTLSTAAIHRLHALVKSYFIHYPLLITKFTNFLFFGSVS